LKNDTDPLKLALRNAHAFPHLHHAAPHEASEAQQVGVTEGKHRVGNSSRAIFSHTFQGSTETSCHFSTIRSPSIPTSKLWSEEAFARIFEYCIGHEVQLLNYSASTAVRATLLAVGFTVGYGPATGPKSTTNSRVQTIPHSLINKGPTLLGEEWLKRWEKK